MDTLAGYVDEERDILFLHGFERGEQRGEVRGEQRGEVRGELRAKHVFVTKLLRVGTYTTTEIADLASVSVQFVEQIKQELTQ